MLNVFALQGIDILVPSTVSLEDEVSSLREKIKTKVGVHQIIKKEYRVVRQKISILLIVSI